MKVKDIMRQQVVCCTPETMITDASRIMSESDCGCLPVVDPRDGSALVGVLTDRDIVCRGLAKGTPLSILRVGECMSTPVLVVEPQIDLHD